jgi:hypothetical protein
LLRNSAPAGSATLRGIAQLVNNAGDLVGALSSTNNTIRVVNGVLQ